MGTTADKLQKVLSTKESIRQAIIGKGVNVNTSLPFSSYSSKIAEIQGVITNVNFINANGVVTSGKFSANLIKNNNLKLGSSKRVGSNKEKINYKAENTYLILKNIYIIIKITLISIIY